MRLIVCWFFILYFTKAFAQGKETVIVLSDKTQLVSIGTQIMYYEDESAALSFQDIIREDHRQGFKQHTKEVYTHQASKSVVWFKINLQNKTGEETWLSTGGNVCWYIDFYRPDGEGNYRDSVQTGAMRAATTKEFPVNFYWLRLADRSDTTVRTYYVRLANGLTQEYFLQAGTIRSLTKNKEVYDFLAAAFVGLMLVMILYNFFLASATKDKIYLTYVCYLISVVVVVTFANGYPFTDNTFLLKYYIGWIPIFFFFATLFAVQYLNLPVNAPMINKVLWGMMACFLMIPVLFMLGADLSEGSFMMQFLLFPFFLTLLFSGVYLLYKGHKNARFYVLGWSFEISSVLIFFLAIDGVLPFNIITRNAVYFGTSMEILMFSLALADRLNILRLEKDKTEAEKLTIIREQNKVLEQRVAERTAEIHHRVKNNLQIISSLINLKSRQVPDEAITILNQLNGRIFSMGLLHEKLYKNENLQVIRLDVYLGELVKYLLDSFQNLNTSVVLELDCDEVEVNIESALTCGLICNELFTNSIKHAFDKHQQHTVIRLSLKQKPPYLEFVMSDNGLSSSKVVIEKSFGLRFVDQLVSTKLKGKCRFDVAKGFAVYIDIPIEDTVWVSTSNHRTHTFPT